MVREMSEVLLGENGFYRDLEEETSGVNPLCQDGIEDINGYRHPGGEIQFSYVDGEIIYSGNEGNNVGGFIGSGWESRVQASYADIDQSVYGEGYSNSIYPVENIGGFIGFARDSSVRSSYARVGQVYGSYRNVAGFVGQSETSTFMYNFAISDVEDSRQREFVMNRLKLQILMMRVKLIIPKSTQQRSYVELLGVALAILPMKIASPVMSPVIAMILLMIFLRQNFKSTTHPRRVFRQALALLFPLLMILLLLICDQFHQMMITHHLMKNR